jgi:hypothetical protein
MATEEKTRQEELGDKTGETRLRGAKLKGSDQKDAVDHVRTDPDAAVHLDGEEDTLYDDGLEVGDDSDTLMGTRGNPLP